MLALRARSPCLFARGRCPLCTPFVGAQLPKQVARLGFYPQSGGRSAPPTPGDFPVAGKVTKGAPRAAPFGIPRCEIFALFALAYASRRAGFSHRKRPICHFEVVGKPVFVVSFGFDQEKYSAVNPWRGRRLVARLGATFGGIRGIGEGVLRWRAGVLCSLCRFCAGSVQQQMA